MKTYEIDELVECQQNEAYFILTYFKTHNPFYGLSTLNLEPKQLNILNRIVGKTFIIDSISERQIGTSTILVAHALWLALFHPNQTIVMMSESIRQSGNLQEKVTNGFENLPDFLKPTALRDNAHLIEFDNRSGIHYTNGDPNKLRGFATTCVIADTFDYYKGSWQLTLRRHADTHGLDTEELLKV